MEGKSRIEERIKRCILAEWSRKIYHILKQIRTENTRDILIKAVSLYVGKRLVLKIREVKIKRNWSPGRKEGFKKAINEVRKDKHLRMSP